MKNNWEELSRWWIASWINFNKKGKNKSNKYFPWNYVVGYLVKQNWVKCSIGWISRWFANKIFCSVSKVTALLAKNVLILLAGMTPGSWIADAI